MTTSPSHTRLRRLLPVGGCVLAAALIGATIPAIAEAGSTPVTYYACVTNKTGALKVVAKSTKCTSGQHKIYWNSTGPRGPRGVPGPPGVVAGYSGAEGAAKLTTSPTTVATLTVPSGSYLVMAKTSVFATSLTAIDDVGCVLFAGSAVLDLSYTQLDPVSGATHDQQTISLLGPTQAGGKLTLQCEDSLAEASGTEARIMAVPVASVSTAAPRQLPRLRSGPAATRLGR